MKYFYKISAIAFFIFCFQHNLYAQSEQIPASLLKSIESPAFGKDIIISDVPELDQYKVALASAYNGWLYAIIAYSGEDLYFKFLKSTDKGQTWNTITDEWISGTNEYLSSVDIIIIGDSVNNLKIVFASVSKSRTDTTQAGLGRVLVLNAADCSYVSGPLHVTNCFDLRLASDYLYPAYNSNPHSFGILCSIGLMYWGIDSLAFYSSSNAGLSLDHYTGIAKTTNHFHKVSLAYGRSPSWSTGRYFAAWEENSRFGSVPGHIFTAHTNPYFYSPFTTPVNLDGLDPSTVNLCQNPVISCQNNDVDNDNSDLTEIVAFEKVKPSDGTTDLKAYYNKKACTSDVFSPMIVSNPGHINIQPDMIFNPYDSSFLLTYYDTTTKKLPLLQMNFNVPSPNNWTVVSPGYNDETNISSPFPVVEFNIGQPEAMNAWIAYRSSGNGIAMFDAPYSVWTGISEIKDNSGTFQAVAYPNPCDNLLTIEFKLNNPENVRIDLLNNLGQVKLSILNENLLSGEHKIKCNVSDLTQGLYFYNIYLNGSVYSGKIIVIH